MSFIGRDTNSEIRISEETFGAFEASFCLESPFGSLRARLGVPGAYNVDNASVAASVALANGVDVDSVVQGLAQFVGASRRFERLGTVRSVVVVDDYGHLPAEVASVIRAARDGGFQRIHMVFQPHRVTRTTALATSFAHAFDGVDDLIVTDIYRAGEDNPDGVTGELVVDAIGQHPGAPRVRYVAQLSDASHEVLDTLGDADLVLLVGAGDVSTVSSQWDLAP